MQIACSRCQTHYDVPDEKLSRGAVKVRCSQCGHTFAVRTRPPKEAEPGAAAPDFESFGAPPLPEPPQPALDPTPELQAKTKPEARFEDFDFQGVRSTASAQPPSPAPAPDLGKEAGLDDLGKLTDETMAAIGELDLGDFDDLDQNLDLRGEPMAAEARPEAPAERVRPDELLSPRSREMPVQGLSEGLPRLDIQRGPRRPEGTARPSPLLARDRRRSPLFWVVAVVAFGTLTYTGYNLYLHPEAFTFLNPNKVRTLWQRRQIEARLGVEGLSGYYRDLRGGRRVFVIRGEVVNRSSGSQSLIQVQGSLFGKDGQTLATREVFCGNVLSDAELEGLSDRDIEARLQNEVGDAMQNMEVAPGARVPFTVVFPSPPDGVDKFSARPVDSRSDSGT